MNEKLVLLSGPRQVGKTTLAKQLWPASNTYLNFDAVDDRVILTKRSWPTDVDLVIFDELHKMKRWKSWIKGIYDTRGVRPRLLVTGSARLDVYRKGGDSLAGRFFSHRLHPFTVAELKGRLDPEEVLGRLLAYGGFPEPFLKNSPVAAERWRRSHIDRILRDDLASLVQVRDVRALELMVELLAERVGSPISYTSLAEDLQVSPHTVKHWLEVLESLYVIFLVKPFSSRLERALLKQPKVYFFDVGRIKEDPGARFENLVALALLKRNHLREDVLGEPRALCYYRDKEKREVDFVTVHKKRVEWLVEAKVSDASPSTALRYLRARAKPERAWQVLRSLRRGLEFDGVRLVGAAGWLASLEDVVP